MDKSPDAFRTISEVAEHLDTPAHVLRFWESRFPQIRPVKRAGGRRYYRPADMALLAGIKKLLHEDGLTIRGVQKILREQGVRHVAALGGMGPAAVPEADVEAVLAAEFGVAAETASDTAEVQTAQVISLEAALARQAAATEAPAPPEPEDIPEAPFVEVEEAPLPEPIAFAPPPAPEAAQADDATEERGEDDSKQPVETLGETTLAMRLRQADPADLTASRAELAAIRARLVELRGRLALGVRRRAR
ncbi:MerR family transcriptional regulator [Paragemmobacter straminiformis]|uniref:MerR family transcriptional regulator n=1 Tax=Paragemmobacter straminiformis TaxID=2045119 RepID=A0A842I9C1_9RHOB|nr:MerR family transcriptional regulator [Gemmobacter straminiformis]MBC2835588.1 MerR family transcriptional regulator [Gemmobacter straminiformis]